jgi:hypothetical protein
MTELEQRLRGLSAEIEYPPTPNLARAARMRIREQRSVESPGRAILTLPRYTLRPLVIAAVLLLLFAGTVFAAVPSVRNSVLDLFGLRGATVEVTSRPPRAPLSTRLRLGEPLSLKAARRLADFSPVVPSLLGPSGQTYLRRASWGDELILRYPPGPGLPRSRYGFGLLVGEFRGDLVPGYVGKIVTGATRVERVRVGRHRGLWVAGAPHYFVYRRPDGRVMEGTIRLAGNALLLERGRLLVRLEGALPKRRALAIAASLR